MLECYGFNQVMRKGEVMFSRTELLLGADALEKLKNSHVIVFGCGGVGGHVVEALVRSGIGAITVVDNDTVSPSNINRQIIATTKNIGQKKTDVIRERVLEINPECEVETLDVFFLPDTELDLSKYNYIVDAIDTVSAKIELAVRANKLGIPIISSMGSGNKLDPTAFRVTDIYKTTTCPLARVMRRELKKRDVPALKVVYSTEEAIKVNSDEIGSVAFVPSVCGLIVASEVIKDLGAVQ